MDELDLHTLDLLMRKSGKLDLQMHVESSFLLKKQMPLAT
jgi:hypothetical protein